MAANPKLRQPGPGWAPFRGWSVLYDDGRSAKAGSLAPLRLEDAVIDANPVYGPLRRWSTTSAGELGDDVAMLPPATYHVTVCDGTNEAHAATATGAAADRLRRLTGSLPGALLDWRGALVGVADAVDTLLDATQRPVTMGPGEVEPRGSALVVALQPDDASAGAVSAIGAARAELLRRLATEYDLDLDGGRPWAPHVTLGYWTDATAAGRHRERLAELAEPLTSELCGARITFAGASVYGFDDMATYWRAP